MTLVGIPEIFAVTTTGGFDGAGGTDGSCDETSSGFAVPCRNIAKASLYDGPAGFVTLGVCDVSDSSGS